MKAVGAREPRGDRDMERKATPHRQPYSFRTFANVLSFSFSLLSVAYCIFLNVYTTETRERVVALETGTGELLYHHVPGFSVDQLNLMIQEKENKLLSQRSYEHLAKIRIAREAPADCNCPAGKNASLVL
ncbi:COPA1 protein, partial [Amia calva]|nr:COPA1 protein [Amia calva]